MHTVILDGHSLNIDSLVSVAREGSRVLLSDEALIRMTRSRSIVDDCVARGDVRYGITTGFGKFCDVVISREQNELLQENLILSHACGTGEPFAQDIVRAMMLLRANALAGGNSGIRPSTVQSLLAMLNAGVHPVIPEKGSLGASGDLAPLAHMVLVLIGTGEAWYHDERMPGSRALALAGLNPVRLTAKEGLALINGTQAMTAVAALACRDAQILKDSAEMAAALTIQALRGIIDAFDARIHAVRGQPGQIQSAECIRSLLSGSRLVTRQGEERIQDAYALRCTPQVHGASRDALGYVRAAIEREMNAVTDNPIIFEPDPAIDGPTGGIISGGNFHGQPVALAMDFLGIACAEYANISERRLERLVNPSLSNGLPAFLTPRGGLNSGFMITQYSAAALVSENKILAHPASVDSIPSSANQEDHVSMGTIAARKARSIITNALTVVSMEILAACQALDLRTMQGSHLQDQRTIQADLQSQTAALLSPRTRQAYVSVRDKVPVLGNDRYMYPDLEAARRLVASGAIADFL